jgi:hypothetical protein
MRVASLTMEQLLSLPKLRDLDKYGVITDVDPFDLPLGAWSMAINLRFEDGRINSAPVWRAVGAPSPIPRLASSTSPTGPTAARRYSWATRTASSLYGRQLLRRPTAHRLHALDAEAAWSGCTLAEVVYMNREDRVPWMLKPTDTLFSNLTGWNSTWRAKLIRSYASAIVALNLTKGGVRYPTMVKTSDIVADPGIPPSSWDETLTTNNATENLLTEMNGEIVDAATLGNSLILYSNSETWP